jgi:trehalose synthase
MAKTSPLREIEVAEAPVARFRPLVDAEVWSELIDTTSRLRALTQGRVVWNVNSTARGGGVAELLAALIPYSRGAGIDERWVVIDGPDEFFEVTKTLHNFLHGVRPEGASLSDRDRRCYEEVAAANAAALLDQVRPGDVAVLHDPQTAGLIPTLRERGIRVVWRAHIGVDQPNELVREAWSFLERYVVRADALVFSRRAYVWDHLGRTRVEIIPPCIDPFAPKNRDLDDAEVATILDRAGLPDHAGFVLQVSRWDMLKDPAGVLDMFAEHVAARTRACLVLAGPAATSVDDDPEQPKVLADLSSRRDALPDAVRDRIVVAQLSMQDIEANALMVNALQRRAEVVVQKSIAEGFGLTVAEAMWKGKPVVASRVGGIEDQIEDGRSGVLVDDPRNLGAFGDAVVDLLRDAKKSRALGHEARRRVARMFITPCHLIAQGRLLAEIVTQ